MNYAYDSDLVDWVATAPDIVLDDLERARAIGAESAASLPPVPVPAGLDVRDAVVPGGDGTRITVRIYTPTAASDGESLPALLYMHGGGFVMGDIEFFHPETMRIADEVGAVVASVDYRLAPEHPFPAALEDCYAVLTWMSEHAESLGIDADRIAVGGESAGGALAAALALLSRDRGGPALRFQYLGVPAIDDRLETVSMRTFVDTPIWNRPSAVLSWKYYLSQGVTVDGRDGTAYAAPARAEDLSGLPPAFITAAEFDPLRDEGLAFAQRLLHAGVSVEVHHYPGTFHGSASMVPEAAVSKKMTDDLHGALRRALHPRR